MPSRELLGVDLLPPTCYGAGEGSTRKEPGGEGGVIVPNDQQAEDRQQQQHVEVGAGAAGERKDACASPNPDARKLRCKKVKDSAHAAVTSAGPAKAAADSLTFRCEVGSTCLEEVTALKRASVNRVKTANRDRKKNAHSCSTSGTAGANFSRKSRKNALVGDAGSGGEGVRDTVEGTRCRNDVFSSNVDACTDASPALQVRSNSNISCPAESTQGQQELGEICAGSPSGRPVSTTSAAGSGAQDVAAADKKSATAAVAARKTEEDASNGAPRTVTKAAGNTEADEAASAVVGCSAAGDAQRRRRKQRGKRQRVFLGKQRNSTLSENERGHPFMSIREGQLEGESFAGSTAVSTNGSTQVNGQCDKQVIWYKKAGAPWWPGVLCNPANLQLTPSPTAREPLRKGRLLVRAFGCSRYHWVKPSNVRDFRQAYDSVAPLCRRINRDARIAVQLGLEETKWTDNSDWCCLSALLQQPQFLPTDAAWQSEHSCSSSDEEPGSCSRQKQNGEQQDRIPESSLLSKMTLQQEVQKAQQQQQRVLPQCTSPYTKKRKQKQSLSRVEKECESSPSTINRQKHEKQLQPKQLQQRQLQQQKQQDLESSRKQQHKDEACIKEEQLPPCTAEKQVLEEAAGGKYQCVENTNSNKHNPEYNCSPHADIPERSSVGCSAQYLQLKNTRNSGGEPELPNKSEVHVKSSSPGTAPAVPTAAASIAASPLQASIAVEAEEADALQARSPSTSRSSAGRSCTESCSRTNSETTENSDYSRSRSGSESSSSASQHSRSCSGTNNTSPRSQASNSIRRSSSVGSSCSLQGSGTSRSRSKSDSSRTSGSASSRKSGSASSRRSRSTSNGDRSSHSGDSNPRSSHSSRCSSPGGSGACHARKGVPPGAATEDAAASACDNSPVHAELEETDVKEGTRTGASDGDAVAVAAAEAASAELHAALDNVFVDLQQQHVKASTVGTRQQKLPSKSTVQQHGGGGSEALQGHEEEDATQTVAGSTATAAERGTAAAGSTIGRIQNKKRCFSQERTAACAPHRDDKFSSADKGRNQVDTSAKETASNIPAGSADTSCAAATAADNAVRSRAPVRTPPAAIMPGAGEDGAEADRVLEVCKSTAEVLTSTTTEKPRKGLTKQAMRVDDSEHHTREKGIDQAARSAGVNPGSSTSIRNKHSDSGSSNELLRNKATRAMQRFRQRASRTLGTATNECCIATAATPASPDAAAERCVSEGMQLSAQQQEHLSQDRAKVEKGRAEEVKANVVSDGNQREANQHRLTRLSSVGGGAAAKQPAVGSQDTRKNICTHATNRKKNRPRRQVAQQQDDVQQGHEQQEQQQRGDVACDNDHSGDTTHGARYTSSLNASSEEHAAKSEARASADAVAPPVVGLETQPVAASPSNLSMRDNGLTASGILPQTTGAAGGRVAGEERRGMGIRIGNNNSSGRRHVGRTGTAEVTEEGVNVVNEHHQRNDHTKQQAKVKQQQHQEEKFQRRRREKQGPHQRVSRIEKRENCGTKKGGRSSLTPERVLESCAAATREHAAGKPAFLATRQRSIGSSRSRRSSSRGSMNRIVSDESVQITRGRSNSRCTYSTKGGGNSSRDSSRDSRSASNSSTGDSSEASDSRHNSSVNSSRRGSRSRNSQGSSSTERSNASGSSRRGSTTGSVERIRDSCGTEPFTEAAGSEKKETEGMQKAGSPRSSSRSASATRCSHSSRGSQQVHTERKQGVTAKPASAIATDSHGDQASETGEHFVSCSSGSEEQGACSENECERSRSSEFSCHSSCPDSQSTSSEEEGSSKRSSVGTSREGSISSQRSNSSDNPIKSCHSAERDSNTDSTKRSSGRSSGSSTSSIGGKEKRDTSERKSCERKSQSRSESGSRKRSSSSPCQGRDSAGESKSHSRRKISDRSRSSRSRSAGRNNALRSSIINPEEVSNEETRDVAVGGGPSATKRGSNGVTKSHEIKGEKDAARAPGRGPAAAGNNRGVNNTSTVQGQCVEGKSDNEKKKEGPSMTSQGNPRNAKSRCRRACTSKSCCSQKRGDHPVTSKNSSTTVSKASERSSVEKAFKCEEKPQGKGAGEGLVRQTEETQRFNEKQGCRRSTYGDSSCISKKKSTGMGTSNGGESRSSRSLRDSPNGSSWPRSESSSHSNRSESSPGSNRSESSPDSNRNGSSRGRSKSSDGSSRESVRKMSKCSDCSSRRESSAGSRCKSNGGSRRSENNSDHSRRESRSGGSRSESSGRGSNRSESSCGSESSSESSPGSSRCESSRGSSRCESSRGSSRCESGAGSRNESSRDSSRSESRDGSSNCHQFKQKKSGDNENNYVQDVNCHAIEGRGIVRETSKTAAVIQETAFRREASCHATASVSAAESAADGERSCGENYLRSRRRSGRVGSSSPNISGSDGSKNRSNADRTNSRSGSRSCGSDADSSRRKSSTGSSRSSITHSGTHRSSSSSRESRSNEQGCKNSTRMSSAESEKCQTACKGESRDGVQKSRRRGEDVNAVKKRGRESTKEKQVIIGAAPGLENATGKRAASKEEPCGRRGAKQHVCRAAAASPASAAVHSSNDAAQMKGKNKKNSAGDGQSQPQQQPLTKGLQNGEALDECGSLNGCKREKLLGEELEDSVVIQHSQEEAMGRSATKISRDSKGKRSHTNPDVEKPRKKVALEPGEVVSGTRAAPAIPTVTKKREERKRDEDCSTAAGGAAAERRSSRHLCASEGSGEKGGGRNDAVAAKPQQQTASCTCSSGNNTPAQRRRPEDATALRPAALNNKRDCNSRADRSSDSNNCKSSKLLKENRPRSDRNTGGNQHTSEGRTEKEGAAAVSSKSGADGSATTKHVSSGINLDSSITNASTTGPIRKETRRPQNHVTGKRGRHEVSTPIAAAPPEEERQAKGTAQRAEEKQLKRRRGAREEAGDRGCSKRGRRRESADGDLSVAAQSSIATATAPAASPNCETSSAAAVSPCTLETQAARLSGRGGATGGVQGQQEAEKGHHHKRKRGGSSREGKVKGKESNKESNKEHCSRAAEDVAKRVSSGKKSSRIKEEPSSKKERETEHQHYKRGRKTGEAHSVAVDSNCSGSSSSSSSDIRGSSTQNVKVADSMRGVVKEERGTSLQRQQRSGSGAATVDNHATADGDAAVVSVSGSSTSTSPRSSQTRAAAGGTHRKPAGLLVGSASARAEDAARMKQHHIASAAATTTSDVAASAENNKRYHHQRHHRHRATRSRSPAGRRRHSSKSPCQPPAATAAAGNSAAAASADVSADFSGKRATGGAARRHAGSAERGGAHHRHRSRRSTSSKRKVQGSSSSRRCREHTRSDYRQRHHRGSRRRSSSRSRRSSSGSRKSSPHKHGRRRRRGSGSSRHHGRSSSRHRRSSSRQRRSKRRSSSRSSLSSVGNAYGRDFGRNGGTYNKRQIEPRVAEQHDDPSLFIRNPALVPDAEQAAAGTSAATVELGGYDSPPARPWWQAYADSITAHERKRKEERDRPRHETGRCTPCNFVFSTAGCKYGNTCSFCHDEDHRSEMLSLMNPLRQRNSPSVARETAAVHYPPIYSSSTQRAGESSSSASRGRRGSSSSRRRSVSRHASSSSASRRKSHSSRRRRHGGGRPGSGSSSSRESGTGSRRSRSSIRDRRRRSSRGRRRRRHYRPRHSNSGGSARSSRNSRGSRAGATTGRSRRRDRRRRSNSRSRARGGRRSGSRRRSRSSKNGGRSSRTGSRRAGGGSSRGNRRRSRSSSRGRHRRSKRSNKTHDASGRRTTASVRRERHSQHRSSERRTTGNRERRSALKMPFLSNGLRTDTGRYGMDTFRAADVHRQSYYSPGSRRWCSFPLHSSAFPARYVSPLMNSSYVIPLFNGCRGGSRGYSRQQPSLVGSTFPGEGDKNYESLSSTGTSSRGHYSSRSQSHSSSGSEGNKRNEQVNGCVATKGTANLETSAAAGIGTGTEQRGSSAEKKKRSVETSPSRRRRRCPSSSRSRAASLILDRSRRGDYVQRGRGWGGRRRGDFAGDDRYYRRRASFSSSVSRLSLASSFRSLLEEAEKAAPGRRSSSSSRRADWRGSARFRDAGEGGHYTSAAVAAAMNERFRQRCTNSREGSERFRARGGTTSRYYSPPPRLSQLQIQQHLAEIKKKHDWGRCRPCRFHYEPSGCRKGSTCEYCHDASHSGPFEHRSNRHVPHII